MVKVKKKMVELIAVIGRKGLNGKKLSDQVQAAIDGGATMIMVKEPEDIRYSEYLQEAMEARMTIGSSDIPFIVYGNQDIAVGLGSDGLHMETGGVSIADMRDMMGTGKILGVTVKDRLQAKAVEQQGADYILAGPMFKSVDSCEYDEVNYDTLKEIKESVSIPVVAFGNIGNGNILMLTGLELDGVASQSFVFGGEDTKKRALELVMLSQAVSRN